MGQFPDIIVHKCDIRCINGNIAADPSHCDPHAGSLESRGVIDTVPDHAYGPAFVLICIDPAQFILWQTSCMHLADAELTCNVHCCVFMIACEQYRIDSGLFDLIDREECVRAYRVGECDQACCSSVGREIDDRASFVHISL